MIKSGMLRGPYLPVFGVGGLIFAFVFSVIDDFFLYIVIATLIAAAWEYMASYILEKAFNRRWWDYSGYKFNLHGRISLQYVLLFGIFATLFGLVYPYIFATIHAMESSLLTFIIGVITGIFTVDLITSIIELVKNRRGKENDTIESWQGSKNQRR